MVVFETSHGTIKIEVNPDVAPVTVENFLKYVVYISTGGGRGKGGGSILFSHAFDEKHPLGKLYRERFGNQVLKERILSVFWKESLRTAQHIRDNRINLRRLFQQNDKLRFLLPVRHPIDCALSNQRTGHAKQFGLGQNPSLDAVLNAILDEFLWFVELQQQHPDRFFCYFENAFEPETVDQLAGFLKLPADEAWKQAVLKASILTNITSMKIPSWPRTGRW